MVKSSSSLTAGARSKQAACTRFPSFVCSGRGLLTSDEVWILPLLDFRRGQEPRLMAIQPISTPLRPCQAGSDLAVLTRCNTNTTRAFTNSRDCYLSQERSLSLSGQDGGENVELCGDRK